MESFSEEIGNKKALKIVPQGEKVLSKNQQLFNRLTKRIEMLEAEIISDTQQLIKLLEWHGKEIMPFHSQIAHLRMKLAMTLGKATQLYNFSKAQTQNIKETILALCNEAFVQVEITPEYQAFYDQWADVTYQEEMEKQEKDDQESYADFMKDLFGMDAEMNEFEDSNQEQFEQSQQNNQHTHHKKFKKKQAKEEAKKAEEAVKSKSIRGIYIALAKVLHPDAEMDESLKSEKEEIMKMVTVAYDKKDLQTLLKLEMEWVHKTSEHLETLSDEKLKIYISALKQQVAELENEKFDLYHNSRFTHIVPFVKWPEKVALSQIHKQKKSYKVRVDEFNSLINYLERPSSKKQIADFVSEFNQ